MTLLPRTNRTVSALRKVAALLFTIVAFFALPAVPASAHNSLIASNPVADSVISAAPTSVTLTFNENVKDFSPLVAVTVGDRKPVEIVPRINGSTVTADLSRLGLPAAGTDPVIWRIGYRIVSADGHPVTGLLAFSVGDGPAATVDADTAASTPTGTAVAQGFPVPAVVIVVIIIVVAAGAVLIRRRRS